MNLGFLTNSELPDKNDKTNKTLKPLVNRVLRWFEKEGDDLVGEKVVNNVSLEHLQKLFKIDPENPMYDCYPVESAEQINYLRNILNFELNTQSYDYFFECDMVEATSAISIKYRICLLINLEGDPNKGEYLVVDQFSENPELTKGDRFHIKDWKVGYSNSQGIGNFSSNFEVQVMSIQRTLFRHGELLVEIFVESPDREEIKKLVDALREHNPDAIQPSISS